MTATLIKTTANAAPLALAKADPDAELILRFYRAAETDKNDALAKARSASRNALICGRLMADKRDSFKARGKFTGVAKPEAEQFLVWIKTHCPEISQTTAYRYMGIAEGLVLKFQREAILDIDAEVLPIADILTLPAAELPENAQKAQQTLFAFCDDHTINQLVTFSKDEAAFKRALNGKTKGGTHKDDDRKDFPKFIGRKLADVSTHLGGFRNFTALQKDQTYIAFTTAMENWPKAVLEHVQQAAKEALKTK